MNEFWGVTALLFIILTVFMAFIIRVMKYYSKYHLVRHDKARMTDRMPVLKSGDILLFIGHTHGFTNSLFTSDLYTHAGMVVKIGDGFYLSEATLDSLPDPVTGEERRLPESSQLNLLHPRLKSYPGMIFLMPLERALSERQEDVLRERARVETPYPGLVHMLKALFRLPSHDRARHCMQHVAWLLDELGLTPERRLARGQTFLEVGFFDSSRAITTLPGEPLAGGNRYGEIVQLLCDLD